MSLRECKRRTGAPPRLDIGHAWGAYCSMLTPFRDRRSAHGADELCKSLAYCWHAWRTDSPPQNTRKLKVTQYFLFKRHAPCKMRRGSPSHYLRTVTWLIWHIGLKVTGRRPFSSILKSSWFIASAQNHYPKSIHNLLLALKSYEYQWHNATFITLQKRSRNSLLSFCFVLDLWTESKTVRSETPPPHPIPIIRLWLEASEQHFS